jgi:uncharacterized cupredoxin-like copper-binding protein
MKPTRLLVTLAAVAALAACSQGTGGSTTGGRTSTPTTAPTTAAPTSTATAAPRPTAPDGAIKVSLTDFAITPATLAAKAGSVVFYVTNDGKTPHNLALFDSTKKDAGHTADLSPGQAAVLTVTLVAGSFHIDCSLPGHESLGMSGTLTVS